MKEDSGEFLYFKNEPSPLQDAVFTCKANGCDRVMLYHGRKWRDPTYDDRRATREDKTIPTWCDFHKGILDYLKKEQEKAQEEDGE